MKLAEYYRKARRGQFYKPHLRFDVRLYRAWSEVIYETDDIESLYDKNRFIPTRNQA